MDAGVYQNGDISESDVTQVTDPSGNCMKFIGYDGEYLSAEGVRLGQFPDPRINIPQIKEMEVKENDIFINAYPKAGEAGGWKNVFTVAQNEMFDAVLAEKMKKCKFEFKYEL
ncbi:hypothetical protein KUTeg_009600 [Tegillarca granosa]|uniref:Sulfotransferase domain-containing protein n=1 Tax=Tegillarca granosa TaxID=220873 RepID=A0ABQ9F7I8_TEGGR|nr:hypothetical protein KUTeg_009600 [Tegillarca granosa]